MGSSPFTAAIAAVRQQPRQLAAKNQAERVRIFPTSHLSGKGSTDYAISNHSVRVERL
jgi:hypothetical protein